MWLWKKFWNTDIVGKTYILIILFIVIVATITIITRYNNVNTNQVLNEQQNEVIQDAVQTEQIQQEVTSENIIDIAEIQENIEKEESITDKPKIKEQEKSVIKTSKEDNKNIAQTETKEEVKIKVNKEETKETVVVQEKEEQQEVQVKEEVKQQETEENIETKEEEVQEESTEVIMEEYRENTALINTMKNYIMNNPSEDMKAYGFEVVVDSSIVELTNQFTYTEQRMRDQLTWRFGTIKIYARDYYYNGEFVITQCFIL